MFWGLGRSFVFSKVTNFFLRVGLGWLGAWFGAWFGLGLICWFVGDKLYVAVLASFGHAGMDFIS